jgi:hypothetical protein
VHTTAGLEKKMIEMETTEEDVPAPKLPSWNIMLAHLTGLPAPESVTPSAPRKTRKVTFETPEDKQE